MKPNNLRILSLRMFKIALACLAAGIVVGMAMPENPSFKGYGGTAHFWLLVLQSALLVAATVANLISLASGAIAWRKGAGHCYWIVVSAMLLLFPLVALAVLFR